LTIIPVIGDQETTKPAIQWQPNA